MTVYLHGLGHFHPENVIDNAFLEALDIDTTDEWIVERTGIRARRTVLPLDYIRTTRNADPRAALEAAEYSNAALVRPAARLALGRAGVNPSDVGLVIGGGSAPDTASPAEACVAAELLGIEAPAFDISSACTSFYAQLYVLSGMRPDALPDFVLLLLPESLTKTVDYADRSASVLWGDGAAAAVVSTRVPARMAVLGTELASSPAGWAKVVVPRIGHFRQEGRTVQAFGIRRMSRAVQRLRATYGTAERPLHFVGHQANLRMLLSVCEAAQIPDTRHHSNVEWYGNTGAASSASVLSERWERWQDGDDVAVAGVGAGLTWSSYLLRVGSEA